jgi:hypothetical protein
MASLLGALFQNESGGRNIANTTRGTSSGQAQGYFQITTGTWQEFAKQAGIDLNRYPTPMKAADGSPVPYEVQAKVAGIIPLKRWDESTIAAMQATGKKVDPNLTLGENLIANGENIATTPDMTTSSGAARHPQNPQVGKPDAAATPAAAAQDLNDEYETLLALAPARGRRRRSRSLADTMSSAVTQSRNPAVSWPMPRIRTAG